VTATKKKKPIIFYRKQRKEKGEGGKKEKQRERVCELKLTEQEAQAKPTDNGDQEEEEEQARVYFDGRSGRKEKGESSIRTLCPRWEKKGCIAANKGERAGTYPSPPTCGRRGKKGEGGKYSA